MKVLIAALGTRGDFELFLALAITLQQRGHEVTLASWPTYLARPDCATLGKLPIGRGNVADCQRFVAHLSAEPNPQRRTERFLSEWILPEFRASAPDLAAAASESDYFVSNISQRLIRNGRPFPGARVLYDPPPNVQPLSQRIAATTNAETLELVALDPQLASSGNWGTDFVFTGFWHAPSVVSGIGLDQEKPCLAQLPSFVETGSAPLVFALGSMNLIPVGPLLEQISLALEQLQARGIVVGGWSQPPTAQSLPASIYWIDEAPYAWLFPRARCIFHHGGYGTVSQALRSGRAMILFPQVAAQQEFARQLHHAGVACVLDGSRVPTADDIIQAIKNADHINASPLPEEWRMRVTEQDGLKKAAELIEQHHIRLSYAQDVSQ